MPRFEIIGKKLKNTYEICCLGWVNYICNPQFSHFYPLLVNLYYEKNSVQSQQVFQLVQGDFWFQVRHPSLPSIHSFCSFWASTNSWEGIRVTLQVCSMYIWSKSGAWPLGLRRASDLKSKLPLEQVKKLLGLNRIFSPCNIWPKYGKNEWTGDCKNIWLALMLLLYHWLLD